MFFVQTYMFFVLASMFFVQGALFFLSRSLILVPSALNRFFFEVFFDADDVFCLAARPTL